MMLVVLSEMWWRKSSLLDSECIYAESDGFFWTEILA